MQTRRNTLILGSLATLASFGGFSAAPAAEGGPLFRFGVVSDPQYAPVPPRLTRFYSNSLAKLADAVETFNKADLQFVVTLGDIIDRHHESFGHILPVYDRLKHPSVFVLGNHDFEVGADHLASVLRTTGLKRAYYDFAGGGYRFVVLDGNDVSLFAHPVGSDRHREASGRLDKLKAVGAANAQTWNGTMSEAQFAWLDEVLARAKAAGERLILFNHYPAYPANEHNLWDEARLLKAVGNSPHVVAYFNGHNHAGNYGAHAGTHFVNFRGMVETAAETAYAIVEVYPDRLEIKGFGVEPSRTLPMPGPDRA